MTTILLSWQLFASELAGKVEVGNLTGPDQDAPFYHAADVFALPSVSRNESYGFVQVEATA